MRKSFAIPFALSLLAASPVWGIVFTDRAFILDPLFSAEGLPPGGFTLLPASGLYGEFAKYPFESETGSDYSWKCVVGGFLEFFRFANSSSFFLSSEVELIADPVSSIRFNPRSLYWTEGLAFSLREGDFSWQLGYYHRCKHDVENLRFIALEGVKEQRSLIYDSLSLRALWEALPGRAASTAPRCVFSLRNDLYLILQDDKKYVSLTAPAETYDSRLAALGSNDIESLMDTVSLEVHVDFPFSGTLGSYASIRGSVDLYGAETGFLPRFTSFSHANFDVFGELGLYFQGQTRLCLFLALERQQDTMIHPWPEEKTLVYIGLKTYDPRYYR